MEISWLSLKPEESLFIKIAGLATQHARGPELVGYTMDNTLSLIGTMKTTHNERVQRIASRPLTL